MVNWTADKDQIILRVIWKTYKLKATQELKEAIAEAIGEDCTPKAVSHRLSKFSNGGPAQSSANNTPVKTNAKSSTTPKKTTPASRARAGKRVQKDEDDDEAAPQALADGAEEILSPLAARGKRNLNGIPKRNYAGMDDEVEDNDEAEFDVYAPISKRIKTEPLEEDYEFQDETEVEV
ncbi:hypothetical protein BDW02DRAFT_602586 [Decorospora gaudefroyi]|uniref:Uncharacterized protein n=1 Tax=Decorospora gaudefroyi TaxID=184978 RepID=A0A6A5JX73_9PLEO|nr:hypothetical protein BDW02DRAFT_602586 [Decorospora gaudefroyi]